MVTWSSGGAHSISTPLLKIGVERLIDRGVLRGWCAFRRTSDSRPVCNADVGDVTVMHALGFDEAKFDGCGRLRNSTNYAELMKQIWGAGKQLPAIENCHCKCTSASCPCS